MHATFWHDRWKTNDISFHQSAANPQLVNFFPRLSLSSGSRVFLPLCGKTRDIGWLLQAGFRVAGAELSSLAVTQLFADLGVQPEITPTGDLVHYAAPGIDIYVGDIFQLTRDTLGSVDAIYDRAALVALPEIMRQRYTAHLQSLCEHVPQLLICFDYDQSRLPGPPFSVDAAEIRHHYQARYQLTLLASSAVPGGLKGQCDAIEQVWLLEPQLSRGNA